MRKLRCWIGHNENICMQLSLIVLMCCSLIFNIFHMKFTSNMTLFLSGYIIGYMMRDHVRYDIFESKLKLHLSLYEKFSRRFFRFHIQLRDAAESQEELRENLVGMTNSFCEDMCDTFEAYEAKDATDE